MSHLSSCPSGSKTASLPLVRGSLRRSLGAVALGALLALPAGAAPLDLGNPTPRGVDVEVDQSVRDYTVQGGAYSTPLRGTFTSDGTVATITVPAAVAAAKLQAILGGVFTIEPGTFSDYVIQIDIATHAVLSATASGRIDTVLGAFDVVQQTSSTTVAGFQIANVAGYNLPVFCDTGPMCTLVPGSGYDPATGRLNAVGSISGAVVPFFTPFGDLRLSEVSPVSCATSLFNDQVTNGDVISVELEVRNDLPTDRAVELKVWATLPGTAPVNLVNIGSEGGAILPAGQVLDFPGGSLVNVGANTARGTWTFGCRLVDPATGETLSTDSDATQVVDPTP
ncbi:MAG TPA: hypothetical protein VMW35_02125 [Myxococcota bacterium]|nr:hypothetical protein [Myxococcota bacterium]